MTNNQFKEFEYFFRPFIDKFSTTLAYSQDTYSTYSEIIFFLFDRFVKESIHDDILLQVMQRTATTYGISPSIMREYENLILADILHGGLKTKTTSLDPEGVWLKYKSMEHNEQAKKTMVEHVCVCLPPRHLALTVDRFLHTQTWDGSIIRGRIRNRDLQTSSSSSSLPMSIILSVLCCKIILATTALCMWTTYTNYSDNNNNNIDWPSSYLAGHRTIYGLCEHLKTVTNKYPEIPTLVNINNISSVGYSEKQLETFMESVVLHIWPEDNNYYPYTTLSYSLDEMFYIMKTYLSNQHDQFHELLYTELTMNQVHSLLSEKIWKKGSNMDTQDIVLSACRAFKEFSWLQYRPLNHSEHMIYRHVHTFLECYVANVTAVQASCESMCKKNNHPTPNSNLVSDPVIGLVLYRSLQVMYCQTAIGILQQWHSISSSSSSSSSLLPVSSSSSICSSTHLAHTDHLELTSRLSDLIDYKWSASTENKDFIGFMRKAVMGKKNKQVIEMICLDLIDASQQRYNNNSQNSMYKVVMNKYQAIMDNKLTLSRFILNPKYMKYVIDDITTSMIKNNNVMNTSDSRNNFDTYKNDVISIFKYIQSMLAVTFCNRIVVKRKDHNINLNSASAIRNGGNTAADQTTKISNVSKSLNNLIGELKLKLNPHEPMLVSKNLGTNKAAEAGSTYTVPPAAAAMSQTLSAEGIRSNILDSATNMMRRPTVKLTNTTKSISKSGEGVIESSSYVGIRRNRTNRAAYNNMTHRPTGMRTVQKTIGDTNTTSRNTQQSMGMHRNGSSSSRSGGGGGIQIWTNKNAAASESHQQQLAARMLHLTHYVGKNHPEITKSMKAFMAIRSLKSSYISAAATGDTMFWTLPGAVIDTIQHKPEMFVNMLVKYMQTTVDQDREALRLALEKFAMPSRQTFEKLMYMIQQITGSEVTFRPTSDIYNEKRLPDIKKATEMFLKYGGFQQGRRPQFVLKNFILSIIQNRIDKPKILLSLPPKRKNNDISYMIWHAIRVLIMIVCLIEGRKLAANVTAGIKTSDKLKNKLKQPLGLLKRLFRSR